MGSLTRTTDSGGRRPGAGAQIPGDRPRPISVRRLFAAAIDLGRRLSGSRAVRNPGRRRAWAPRMARRAVGWDASSQRSL